MKRSTILEVIVSSVEDAIAAQQGGADRLEIVRDLECGGLTPPPELAERILSRVDLPVRVMLRNRPDFLAGSVEELQKLAADACRLAALPIDGLVAGFVSGETLDVDSLRAAVSAAPVPVTVHHAIEAVSDPLAGITDLKQVGQVDRLLTHGGSGEWRQRLPRFRALCAAASPQMKILAGGGLGAAELQLLFEETPVREFHFGRAVRANHAVAGNVRRDYVRELAELLARLEQGVATGH